jgi:Arc/MetJ family transcription regulator
MRTNIEIDDELMRQAMAATGTTTKKAAVEEALRLTVQLKRQGEAIRSLRGLAVWRGHDDDWFASDEEIVAKRKDASSYEASARESEEQDKQSQLAGDQGRR